MTGVFFNSSCKYCSIVFCPEGFYAVETKAISKLFIDVLLFFIIYDYAIALALGYVTHFAFKCNSAAWTKFIFMPAHAIVNF